MMAIASEESLVSLPALVVAPFDGLMQDPAWNRARTSNTRDAREVPTESTSESPVAGVLRRSPVEIPRSVDGQFTVNYQIASPADSSLEVSVQDPADDVDEAEEG